MPVVLAGCAPELESAKGQTEHLTHVHDFGQFLLPFVENICHSVSAVSANKGKLGAAGQDHRHFFGGNDAYEGNDRRALFFLHGACFERHPYEILTISRALSEIFKSLRDLHLRNTVILPNLLHKPINRTRKLLNGLVISALYRVHETVFDVIREER